MTYSPLLLVHILGGIIGTFSGFVALVARKGGPLHRKSGEVFVISMLGMASSGAYLALMKSQSVNLLAGLFTVYLVATACLTVMRKEGTTGRAEVGLLLLGLGTGTTAWALAWRTAHGMSGGKAGALDGALLVFGLLAFLSAAGDARMIFRGGVSGARRIVRHLWRMCFGLFIAAGSFFLGKPSDPVLRRVGLRATLFPDSVRRTHLPEIPVLLILVLMVYWLCRVRFTNEYKRAARVEAVPVPSVADRPIASSGVGSHRAIGREPDCQ